MIAARQTEDDRDLLRILAMQRANLRTNLSAAEQAGDGFVTVEHTLDVLKRMHALAPSVIATDGDSLAAYALVMPLECRSFLPILDPMFERLRALGVLDRRC